MSLAETIKRLRDHPDATEKLGPDSGGRANGFQALGIFCDGAVRVTYHWGSRSFRNLDELHGWLNGQAPANWQE